MTQAIVTTPAQVKERILFEARPNILPAILTFENLTLIGMVALGVLFSVVFHVGPMEMAIVIVLFVLLAFPSIQSIFQTGSTTYVLTNQRVVIFTFGLRQKEQSIPLDEIQSATHKFSGLQRFYGAGDVLINRKGFRRPVRLRALPQCKQRALQVTQAVAAYHKNHP